MKRTRRMQITGIGGAVAVGLAATMVGVLPAQAADITIRPGDIITGLSDTRANGSVEFLREGILVKTTDTSSQSKAAEYWARSGSIPTSGSYVWTGTPGQPESPLSQPGAQVVFDTDADRGNEGSFNVLVGEQVYSSNARGEDLTDWWYTGGAARAAQWGITCPSTTGGSGSDCHGSLEQWAKALPNAQVYAAGFSLGSGVKGEGHLRSLSLGEDTYAFTSSEPAQPQPTVTVTAEPSPAPTETVTAEPSPGPTVTVTPDPEPTKPERDVTGRNTVAKSKNAIRVTLRSDATPAANSEGDKLKWRVVLRNANQSSETRFVQGASERDVARYVGKPGRYRVIIQKDGVTVRNRVINLG